MDWQPAWEVAKIASGGLAGATLTLLYGRFNRVNKSRVAIDVIGQRTVGFDTPGLDVKVLFNGQEYKSIHFYWVSIDNVGSENVDDVDLILWMEDAEREDWCISIIQSDAKFKPQRTIIDQTPPYITLQVDSLNPKMKDSFIVVSKYAGDLKVASKKKNLYLIDRREQRKRTEAIALKLVRLSSPISISIGR